MTESVYQIANSLGLWLVSFCLVIVVLIQALLYTRLAFKSAAEIGFPKEKCIQGFKSGMISAIGPSIAVFIVMIGLMSIVGVPYTWAKLSTIGSAPAEMTIIKLCADVMGIDLTANSITGDALFNMYWTMAINSCGWLLVVLFFANKMESIRQKIGGGDTKWMALFGLATSLSAFAYMNSSAIVPIIISTLEKTKPQFGSLAACLGGMASMIALVILSRKLTWLKEYNLGIAMLVGMSLAIIFS